VAGTAQRRRETPARPNASVQKVARTARPSAAVRKAAGMERRRHGAAAK